MWEFDRNIDIFNSEIPNAAEWYKTNKPNEYQTHFEEWVERCIQEEEVDFFEEDFEACEEENEKFYKIR